MVHAALLLLMLEAVITTDLVSTPGVGPVVALTYRATVDVPARFRKSKAVGAVFGLTCAKYQSGEVDRNGRAMKIARHRGMKKAIVALARRLAVIMHRIWVDGTEFRWTREVAAA